MFFNRKEIQAFLVLCLFTAFPPPLNADSGVAGWQIFKKLKSSQFETLSMLSPVDPEISGALYNPAVLGFIRRRELLFLSERGFSGDRTGGVIFSLPAGRGMFAVGGAYYDSGAAELDWIDGGSVMSRDVTAQRDFCGSLTYEHPLSAKIFAGLTLKGAVSTLAEDATATAWAGDAGIIYSPRATRYYDAEGESRMVYALALQNAGRGAAFSRTEDKLPETVFLGAAYSVRSGGFNITAAGGAGYVMPDEKSYPEAGIEIGVLGISLNAGCRFWENESSLHFGLRFDMDGVSCGYAFIPSAHMDAVHRLTVGLRFLPSAR